MTKGARTHIFTNTHSFLLNLPMSLSYFRLGQSLKGGGGLGVVVAGTFTGWMPFLSPNQQIQSTNELHNTNIEYLQIYFKYSDTL